MIKPLCRNLLVEELPPEPNKAGLTIPEIVRQDPVYIVRGKGPKADPAIYEGDRVLLDQYSMSSKHQAGERLWVIPDSAVCLVLSPQAQ